MVLLAVPLAKAGARGRMGVGISHGGRVAPAEAMPERLASLGRIGLHPGDVGGQEVDAVAVEVAAGAVVVLGSARVGVPGQDLRVPEGDAGVE